MDTQRKQKVKQRIIDLKDQLKNRTNPLTIKAVKQEIKMWEDILEVIEEQEAIREME